MTPEEARRLIRQHETMSEEEIIEADEWRDGKTAIVVPDELLPVIRQLLASHKPG